MEAIQADTILNMEEYNFNAPINVKIIYDDDEETSEGIMTQNKNAQVERRQWGNMSYTTVGSNLGEQAQVETFKGINSIVHSDTLKVVIENMAAIIGARFKFQQVYKTLSTAEVQRFKSKYIEMKYLLFKRSMTVAKSLLLPQKSNEIFTETIVVEILQKAKVNNNMYSIVRLLYTDLIAWTEAQLGREEKDVGAPKNLGLDMMQSNLNSGLRKRSHTSTEDTNALREMLRKKICQIETQSTEGGNSCPSFVSNLSNMVYSPPNLTTYHNPHENYLNEINGLNPLSMQEQQYYLSIRGHSTIEYQKTMQTNISQSSVDNSSHLEKNRYDGQDVSRSSISRDSGFTSPDILFSPQESTNTNYQDPSPWPTSTSTQNTPIPNISSNRRVGWCQVCGKQTDLLCLGCFKYFYCSFVCQNIHWTTHRLRCQNSPTSNTLASNYENIR